MPVGIIELGTNYPSDYQEGWSSCFGGSGADGEAPEVAWSVRTVVGGVSSTYSGRLAPHQTQEVTTFSVR